MRFQYIKPTGILSHFIRHYWILEADDSDGQVCERVIPTGNIEMMFHYRRPFIVNTVGEKSRQPGSFISGLSNRFMDVTTDGLSGVVAVTFFPHGACNFFRFPLYELENKSIDLGDIVPARLRETEEKIVDAGSTEERIMIIEKFLLSLLIPAASDNLKVIRESVRLIDSSGGQIKPFDIAGRLCLSEKSLERKFSAFLGKTPQQFIRIVRFQDVIRSLSAPGGKSLTTIAYEKGYFDQAHFIKDFKALSGYTPGEFIGLGPCNADYFEAC